MPALSAEIPSATGASEITVLRVADLVITPQALSDYRRAVNKHLQTAGFCPRTVAGDETPLERIYHLTQQLSLGIIEYGPNGVGDVSVITPQLRSRRPGDKPSFEQKVTLDMGMERARLGHIQDLLRAGEINDEKAVKLAGGILPDEAINKLDDRFSDFRWRKKQTNRSAPVGRSGAFPLKFGSIPRAAIHQDAPDYVRAHSKVTTKKVIGVASLVGSLLTACGASGNTSDRTPIPSMTATAGPTSIATEAPINLDAFTVENTRQALRKWEHFKINGAAATMSMDTRDLHFIYSKDPLTNKNLMLPIPILNADGTKNTDAVWGFGNAKNVRLGSVPDQFQMMFMSRYDTNTGQISILGTLLESSTESQNIYTIGTIDANGNVTPLDYKLVLVKGTEFDIVYFQYPGQNLVIPADIAGVPGEFTVLYRTEAGAPTALPPTAEPEFSGEVQPGLTDQNMVGGIKYDSALSTFVTKNADGEITGTWNAETNSWDYNRENLLYVDYEIDPVAWTPENDLQSGLYAVTWTRALAEKLNLLTPAEILDNAAVPDGEFYSFTEFSSDGKSAMWHEFGAVVGDIILVRPSDQVFPANQYVVQLQIINPKFPDRRYLLDYPLSDSEISTRSGTSFSEGFPDNPQRGSMLWTPPAGTVGGGIVRGADLVSILQNMRGQKVIVKFPTNTDSANSRFVNEVRNFLLLVEAINNGRAAPNIVYPLHIDWVRLPHNLYPNQ